MRKVISYSEAVALLGGSGPLVETLDKALGGLLLVGTAGASGLAISLFDAKAEAVKLGTGLLGGLRDRLRGYSRLDRTQRVYAAHAVIVVTAFFAAVDDLELPFKASRLRLTERERLAVTTGSRDTPRLRFFDQLRMVGAPTPVAHRTPEQFADELLAWYRTTSGHLLEFVRGLAVWDEIHEHARARVSAAFEQDLPRCACRRYEDLHLKLAGEVPEFGWWATRTEVGSVSFALTRLQCELDALAAGRRPDERRAALSRAWNAALNRPIMVENDASAELTFPTLADAYVDPDFKVRAVDVAGMPAGEWWWEEAGVRTDLVEFLAGHLATLSATEKPLLVLGQPGSGKSVLTKVLAARLPAADFLPIRVVLREVPVDTDLQRQIEYGIRAATGTESTWPELTQAAHGALPVVMLDGFDELLQATGVSQSDYLERVAEFQQREAAQGRPVAVVVTSRTAVADRMRTPVDTVCLRLEPFRPEQVTAWLEVWNSANSVAFHDRGLAPLPAEVVLRHPVLAGQPLLLFMLAMYDAASNALQQDVERLDQAGLYERLLCSFARREIRRIHVGASERELDRLVEHELLQLAVASFAMFNRHRQWVTAAELDADLAALVPRRRADPQAGFRDPLNEGEKLVGRFFFVQRAEAQRDGRRLETYEFLHATFGEYLLARLVLQLLTDLAAEEAAAACAVLRSGGCQDSQLSALLSFAALASRDSVLIFLDQLAGQRCGKAGWQSVQDLPVTLFLRLDERTPSDDVPNYQPVNQPGPDRYAVYALNLVLVAVVLAGEVRATTLFPEAAEPVLRWRRHALLWQAALPPVDWAEVFHSVRTRTEWERERRDLVVRLDTGSPVPPPDPYWLYEMPPEHRHGSGLFSWMRTSGERLVLQSALVRDRVNEVMIHALWPLLETLGDATTMFVSKPDHSAESVAHTLIRLALCTGPETPVADLVGLCEHAVGAATWGWAPFHGDDVRRRSSVMVLDGIAPHAARLPAADLARWLGDLLPALPHTREAARTVLDCVLNRLAADPRSITDLRPVVVSLLGDRGTSWLRVQAWVGLAEAGLDSTEIPNLDAKELLATLSWDALRHEDPRLAARAGWLAGGSGS